jgi:uncharacterized protein YneF (UPF0154 family)
MNKKISISVVLIFVIFIGGFLTGRMFRPYKIQDVEITDQMLDKIAMQKQLKKESERYIDSANCEMFNYALKYHHLTPNILPDAYKGYDEKIISYNKEEFFYYYSMYKITDYLSKAKSSMINAMIIENENN